jgi:predicted enzyme related to lactoylglutathione lyase
MTNPVVHWEIGGRDLAALREFYSKAFGWAISEDDTGYQLVQPADGGLGGGLMQTRDDMPAYVTIYVQVEDLDAALGTISSLGGIPLVPPTTINDRAAFALFRDPEGNVVGLLHAAGPIAA